MVHGVVHGDAGRRARGVCVVGVGGAGTVELWNPGTLFPKTLPRERVGNSL